MHLFVKNLQDCVSLFVAIDILGFLCLNILTEYFKDFDGKFALFLKLQRAGGWCEPVR